MIQAKNNVFEKHPKKTLIFISVFLLGILYGLCSLKIIKNAYTEYEAKSLKLLLQQYYASKIIDNNVGRFIKLREHKPNQERFERPSRNYMKHVAPDTIERKYYRINTDENGFIGPSSIHANPDFKIVFLGGSTTECLYLEEEQRFPYLVGRQLEKALGKKINSYNGGVSANESMHNINILLNKVLPMKPQIVVMMENINDLVVLRAMGSYWYPHSLKSHVQTAKNVFTRHELFPGTNTQDEQQLLLEFQRNLETFIAICRIRDILPVLMTQANRVQGDLLYHQFNQKIREVGQKHDVLVIDLAQAIPQKAALLYDSYHYTAIGSQMAAEVITAALAQQLR